MQLRLGILRLGDWYGHEGEVIGWETLELHDPDTDVTIVIAVNGCAIIKPLLALIDEVYPDTGLEALLRN